MDNPFNEERQQQLKNDVQEFLVQFSKEYLRMYGAAILEESAATETDTVEQDTKRLTYREWNSIERSELFKGSCFMKKGPGPGAFGKWKKVYIVEKQDYNIDVFKTDKDAQGNKKPVETISVCGYTLERDPNNHYRNEMRTITNGLGLPEGKLQVTFSPWSWALTHSIRTNYVFQLHAGKDPFCPCIGGSAAIEPDDIGSENENERETWLEFMDLCSNKASARDVKIIGGIAFEKTVGKMVSHFSSLTGFTDDGKESEILVDMLIEHCLVPMRDMILGDITGPDMLKVVAWYNIRYGIVTTLNKLVDPAWSQMQSAGTELAEKTATIIGQGVEPIFKALNAIKELIYTSVSEKVAGVLTKVFTPFLQPFFKAFETPLQEGFQTAKDIFTSKVREAIGAGLPPDMKQTKLILDQIPRTGTNVNDVYHKCSELVEPLRKLIILSPDVFTGLDPSGLRIKTGDLIIQTLDAAIYTLELQLETQGIESAESIIAALLPDFDHDTLIQKAEFMKEMMRSILIPPLMTQLDPIVSPIIDGFTSNIPEEMQGFISISSLFDEMVEHFVAEPIDKVVEAAYSAPSIQG